VLEANRLLQDAFQTDVRPALAELRAAGGLPADPYRAYLESGEAAARETSRAGGVAAGWG
jgi:L-rhamnose isomerase / sugar isomerase